MNITLISQSITRQHMGRTFIEIDAHCSIIESYWIIHFLFSFWTLLLSTHQISMRKYSFEIFNQQEILLLYPDITRIVQIFQRPSYESYLVNSQASNSERFRQISTKSDKLQVIPTYADKVRHNPKNSDLVRHTLTNSDIFWQMPTYSDKCRHILTNSDIPTNSLIVWKIPTSSDILTYSDKCRQISTYSDKFRNIPINSDIPTDQSFRPISYYSLQRLSNFFLKIPTPSIHTFRLTSHVWKGYSRRMLPLFFCLLQLDSFSYTKICIILSIKITI